MPCTALGVGVSLHMKYYNHSLHANIPVNFPTVKTVKIREQKGQKGGRFFCQKRISVSNVGDWNSKEIYLTNGPPMYLFSEFVWKILLVYYDYHRAYRDKMTIMPPRNLHSHIQRCLCTPAVDFALPPAPDSTESTVRGRRRTIH